MSSETYRLQDLDSVVTTPVSGCDGVVAAGYDFYASGLGNQDTVVQHHFPVRKEVFVRGWFGLHDACPAMGRSSVLHCCFQSSLGSTGSNGLMSPLGRESESAAVLVVLGCAGFRRCRCR